MVTCLFCLQTEADAELYNISVIENDHKIWDDLTKFFGHQIEGYLLESDYVCLRCVIFYENLAYIKDKLGSLLCGRDYYDFDAKASIFAHAWEKFVYFSRHITGDSVDDLIKIRNIDVASPSPQIATYTSPYDEATERRLEDEANRRSVHNTAEDGEVEEIFRKRRGYGWTRTKNGRRSSRSISRSKSYPRAKSRDLESRRSINYVYDENTNPKPRKPRQRRPTPEGPRPRTRSVAYKEQYNVEMKQKEGKKILKCSQCDIELNCPDIRNDHEFNEHGCVQLFFCNEPGCDKKYTRGEDLVVHEREHERTFLCMFCCMRISGKEEFDQHYDNHMICSLQCYYCSLSFVDLTSLEEHTMNNHKGSDLQIRPANMSKISRKIKTTKLRSPTPPQSPADRKRFEEFILIQDSPPPCDDIEQLSYAVPYKPFSNINFNSPIMSPLILQTPDSFCGSEAQVTDQIPKSSEFIVNSPIEIVNTENVECDLEPTFKKVVNTVDLDLDDTSTSSKTIGKVTNFQSIDYDTCNSPNLVPEPPELIVNSIQDIDMEDNSNASSMAIELPNRDKSPFKQTAEEVSLTNSSEYRPKSIPDGKTALTDESRMNNLPNCNIFDEFNEDSDHSDRELPCSPITPERKQNSNTRLDVATPPNIDMEISPNSVELLVNLSTREYVMSPDLFSDDAQDFCDNSVEICHNSHTEPMVNSNIFHECTAELPEESNLSFLAPDCGSFCELQDTNVADLNCDNQISELTRGSTRSSRINLIYEELEKNAMKINPLELPILNEVEAVLENNCVVAENLDTHNEFALELPMPEMCYAKVSNAAVELTTTIADKTIVRKPNQVHRRRKSGSKRKKQVPKKLSELLANPNSSSNDEVPLINLVHNTVKKTDKLEETTNLTSAHKTEPNEPPPNKEPIVKLLSELSIKTGAEMTIQNSDLPELPDNDKNAIELPLNDSKNTNIEIEKELKDPPRRLRNRTNSRGDPITYNEHLLQRISDARNKDLIEANKNTYLAKSPLRHENEVQIEESHQTKPEPEELPRKTRSRRNSRPPKRLLSTEEVKTKRAPKRLNSDIYEFREEMLSPVPKQSKKIENDVIVDWQPKVILKRHDDVND